MLFKEPTDYPNIWMDDSGTPHLGSHTVASIVDALEEAESMDTVGRQFDLSVPLVYQAVMYYSSCLDAEFAD